MLAANNNDGGSQIFAPVFITVYDRVSHFKDCVESLKKNIGAENTVLYVSSDGPVDFESSKRVNEIRQHIKCIDGFKKVISFEAKENTRGQIRLDSFNKVRSDNKCYITTEDDNIFSPYALDFINNGLKIYEEDESVHGICAYQYPGFPAKKFEQIYLKDCTVWGIGLWRDKDIPIGFDRVALANEALTNQELFKSISSYMPTIPLMNKSIVDGLIAPAGDVTRINIIYKNNLVCVFPPISLVRNVGHDGSGMHCGVNHDYERQEVSCEQVFYNLDKPVRLDEAYQQWIEKYLRKFGDGLYNKILFAQANSKNYGMKFVFGCVARGANFLLRGLVFARRNLRNIFND